MDKKDTAVIFDIQRFCLHDGPGIRTVVFFKGCPLRCRWCQNPESHKKEPELFFSKTRCIQCGDCVSACPGDALRLEDRIRIDYSRCNACGRCAETCASGALRMAGRNWKISALVDEVLKDRDYFAESGGGVTLSGGEPLMQHAFVREFCEQIKSQGIHVLIETCGFFILDNLAPALPDIDQFFYDLKLMDPDLHQKYTGVPNTRILENFIRLCETGAAVQARMPVIPQVNDTRQNIAQTAAFLRHAGHETIHCLPYHDFWKSKVDAIDTNVDFVTCKTAEEQTMGRVQTFFKREKITAVVYGI